LGYNILGQPTLREPWTPPADYQGPLENNDRSYNVIGQKVLLVPAPPQALPLSQLGADSKLNRGKSRYNVIGQKLMDPRHICIREEYVDTRPYNVIGQPVFPAIPPTPPKGSKKSSRGGAHLRFRSFQPDNFKITDTGLVRSGCLFTSQPLSQY